LRFENVVLSSPLGGRTTTIASYFSAGSVLENILIDGISVAKSGNAKSGSLVGYGEKGSIIRNCEVRNGKFERNLSGMAGLHDGEFHNCKVEGIFSASSDGGFLFADSSEETIYNNCLAMVSVSTNNRNPKISGLGSYNNCYYDSTRFIDVTDKPFKGRSTNELYDSEFYYNIDWNKKYWKIENGAYPTLKI